MISIGLKGESRNWISGSPTVGVHTHLRSSDVGGDGKIRQPQVFDLPALEHFLNTVVERTACGAEGKRCLVLNMNYLMLIQIR